MRRLADALTLARLLLALVLPAAILRGGSLAAVLWVLAAASDFADGPIARRAGTASRRGMLFDNAADIAFVLGGLATAAALGLVPWLVPGAVALAVVDYARTSFEASRGMAAPALARSPLGHAAGVVNYACLGIVLLRLARPGAVAPWLRLASELATIVLNVAAVLVRALQRGR